MLTFANKADATKAAAHVKGNKKINDIRVKVFNLKQQKYKYSSMKEDGEITLHPVHGNEIPLGKLSQI